MANNNNNNLNVYTYNNNIMNNNNNNIFHTNPNNGGITSLNLSNHNKDYSNYNQAIGGGAGTPPGFYEKHPELLNKPMPRTD